MNEVANFLRDLPNRSVAGRLTAAHARCMASRKLTMGRRSDSGAYYAVTAVTKQRTTLLRSRPAIAALRRAFDDAEFSGFVRNHAWVIMPDHVHWLFELASGTLSEAVGRFKSMSAREVNRSMGRHGSVWQAGYYDHRLRDDEDLEAQCRYIVENPARAGLTTSLIGFPGWWCRWISSDADFQAMQSHRRAPL